MGHMKQAALDDVELEYEIVAPAKWGAIEVQAT